LAFEQGDRSLLDPIPVGEYCEQTKARLLRLRNGFVAENIYLLMDSVSSDCVSGPVMAPQIH